MLAIVGASGKLGFATLSALLEHKLIPASQIVCTTSSPSGADKLRRLDKDLQVRSANWDDQGSFEAAFEGCDKIFLISSSRIERDFHDAPPNQGRESDQILALEAATKAGVRHVYYTSLAFANPSQSRVMKAHERTEEWLAQQTALRWTVLRMGLYSESWPLYFGHYAFPGDERKVVRVGGDGKISWTAIADIGLASALVLAADAGEWEGETFYLSQRQAWTLKETAEMVGKVRGKDVKFEVVSREEHERYHVKDLGLDEANVEWWAKTYDALRNGECEIDDSTLEDLLAMKGVSPKSMKETIKEMFAAASKS